jgi:hypothetical protein
MKIIQNRDLEDCLDGTFIKELTFDDVVNKELIDYLSKDGELEYYPNFSRPFYKIIIPDRYMIQGVEKNNTARLVINKNLFLENFLFLENCIHQFTAK